MIGTIARAWSRTKVWAVRLVIPWMALIGFVPPPMHLAFLLWLREEMDPRDPRMKEIVVEIAQLEEVCRA